MKPACILHCLAEPTLQRTQQLPLPPDHRRRWPFSSSSGSSRRHWAAQCPWRVTQPCSRGSAAAALLLWSSRRPATTYATRWAKCSCACWVLRGRAARGLCLRGRWWGTMAATPSCRHSVRRRAQPSGVWL
jgi:hypothetical protein